MGATRRFIDSYGFQWMVSEIEREGSDDRPPPLADVLEVERGWLYFFSRGCTMVLTNYPSDWTVASWEELERLCRRALVLGRDVHSATATAIRPPSAEARA